MLAGVGTVTLVDNTPCGSGALYNFLVPADADPQQRYKPWLSKKQASRRTCRLFWPLDSCTYAVQRSGITPCSQDS